jgi:putative DNA methylase
VVSPIKSVVRAEPYRPVYGMHRYFARRPHTVFAHLIEHYSEPGDLIVDPFYGGGVTLVEGALLGRRAIGYDLNPMAGFITCMELARLDEAHVEAAYAQLLETVAGSINDLFRTHCPSCGSPATASWFEVSAVARCERCDNEARVSELGKVGPGAWGCPSCRSPIRFSVSSATSEELDLIHLRCHCGYIGSKAPDGHDIALYERIPCDLAEAEARGVFVPAHEIPDCNMQRESALHKKGIRAFRQLFTPRVLLSWALLREALARLPEDETSAWLWFTFSASLRYANRMVTRNPGWRGDKPLEWAKPGYWLPSVHLEVNVLDQFERRFASILRAKAKLPTSSLALRPGPADEVLAGEADYSVNVGSSTALPLPDRCVDAVITDPPYGSYVHYADLTNFWSIWLPEWLGGGLGRLADTTEEAVVARKRGFPGAKTAVDYAEILSRCFRECRRVLKPGGSLVLTFNNREPRAWVALLAAATQAGFELAPGGVIFQPGIKVYEHTSQSRRAGSVVGDFIYTFRVAQLRTRRVKKTARLPNSNAIEAWFIEACRGLLSAGPMSPRDLFTQLYMEGQLYLAELARDVGEKNLENLVRVVDELSVFDSHRRQLLERYFDFRDGLWTLRKPDEVAA